MKDQRKGGMQAHVVSQAITKIVAMHTKQPPPSVAMYWPYWGKARPVESGPECHLLPYHCLDVAAVGVAYLRHQPALLQWLALQLGTSDEQAVCDWLAFWLALHDLGKFSISFQGQREDLVERLQGEAPSSRGLPGVRHDSLGFACWRQYVQPLAIEESWFGDDRDVLDGIDCWWRAVTGHHGQPPIHDVHHLGEHFRPRDRDAAMAFTVAMKTLFLSPAASAIATGMDAEAFEQQSREVSWWVAGLAVLADWIGSNADIFKYRDAANVSLADYWSRALVMAETALSHSGVRPAARQSELPFAALFPAIATPSPLQSWAASVPLPAAPQIYLLEDVTGAGKTEAAVALTHRLMANGLADGFFIGLPTMATANAMYGRIAHVYPQLFAGDASLVLAHGRKTLVEEFAASVIEPGVDEADAQQGDESATRRCLRWLADHNKRALLAPAGVGTVDQALLGALQSKHQSLRLLGLVRKVLVVDEVHACDAYMQRTLEAVLEFHAHAGGSAILLSATLPSRMKALLLAAFARGCGHRAPTLTHQGYPLVSAWSPQMQAAIETPIATRPEVCRQVFVRYEPDRAVIVQTIVAALNAGRSVAWIRNTIGDALQAHTELAGMVDPAHITVFHARFALGDRLDIEQRVLDTFGPDSTPTQRAGRLLIATQVAEQSLDIDVDLLVSDLAPIDRLVQRAGRLRRHVRDADGQRLHGAGAVDQRGAPCMWVLGPPWTDAPASNWLQQFAPGSAAVYPHHGEMWRTARALQVGQFRMPDDARALIEAVFDADDELPEGLRTKANQAEGRAYGDRSQAQLNSVKLANGYKREGLDWTAETVAPSRLGEETIDVLLGRWDGDRLLPWRHDKPAQHAWAYSTVRVAKRLIAEAAPQRSAARQAEVQSVCERLPGGGKWLVLLPLEHANAGFSGAATAHDKQGAPLHSTWFYDAAQGLLREALAS
jgi:CRISPR-associated endonuclease/helicase Cas3